MSEPAKPYIFRADLSNHRFLKKKDVGDNTCSGKGFTVEKAKISALGEAVERYSGACYSKNEIIISTYNKLDENKLNPEDLVLFSRDQYENLPYKPYSHDSLMGWVNAYSLKNDKPIYVPAVSVFMNYELQTEEEYIFQITSNGLAAGNTLQSAILSAALEIVERDAFIIAWHNKFPCRRVDPLSVPGDDELKEFINAYKRRGVELCLFELPTDFPCHVFMALGIQENGEGPYSVTGLGADFDPVVAARSALIEVGQVRPALKKRLRQKSVQNKLRELLNDPTQVKELDDHDLLFAAKEASFALNFLLSRNMEKFNSDIPVIDESEKLDRLINHVRSINSDLIYYDLTPTDMKRLGLYTCRAIIPYTQPIHFGYENIRLGGPRLYDQSVQLGFSKKPKTVAEIDLFPHPLA
jgi:ribosomal protein S12 methylthiotransferase accessory factor